MNHQGEGSRFHDTPNKVLVRTSVDLKVVSQLSTELGRGLSYFGLPGAEALDVLCWKDHISQVDAVERSHMNRVLLQEILTLSGMNKGLRIFETDIESLVATERVDEPELLHAYDLVNLDFEGYALAGSKDSPARKIECIKKLTQIQDCCMCERFILLLTLWAARSSHQEFRLLCERAKAQLNMDDSLAKCLEKAIRENTQKHYLSLGVPLWVCSFGQFFGYEPEHKATVFYQGTSNVPMVHFAFLLRRKGKSIHGLVQKRTSSVDFLTGIKEAKKGKLVDISLF